MKKINFKTLLVTLLLSQGAFLAPNAEANTFEKARKALEIAKEKAKEIKDKAIEATKESLEKIEQTIEDSKIEIEKERNKERNKDTELPNTEEKTLDQIDPNKKINLESDSKNSDLATDQNDKDVEEATGKDESVVKDESAAKDELPKNDDISDVKIISSGKHDDDNNPNTKESVGDLASNNEASEKVLTAKGDGKTNQTSNQGQLKTQQENNQKSNIFPWNKADPGINNTDTVSYDSTIKVEYSVKSERNWAYFQIQKVNSNANPVKHAVPIHNGLISTIIPLREGPGQYRISLYTTTSSTRNATYYQYLAFNKTVENKDNRDSRNLLPSDDVQSKNSQIISLAKEIVGNSKTQREAVIKINKWIMDNIEYDYVSLENGSFQLSRQDALTTLRDRMAVCEGFSNLFAALARASGIKTRVMSGLGNGGAGFGLHAWNEVYFDGQWHNIDVTWDQNLRSQTYIFMNKSEFSKTHKDAVEREHR